MEIISLSSSSGGRSKLQHAVESERSFSGFKRCRDRVAQAQIAGSASGVPLGAIAGTFQRAAGFSSLVRKRGAHRPREVEPSIAVRMRAPKLEEGSSGRMQHVQLGRGRAG